MKRVCCCISRKRGKQRGLMMTADAMHRSGALRDQSILDPSRLFSRRKKQKKKKVPLIFRAVRLGCVYNILILKKWNFNFLFGYFGFLSNWERVWVRDDLGCCLFRLLLFTITQQFDFIFSGLTGARAARLLYFIFKFFR